MDSPTTLPSMKEQPHTGPTVENGKKKADQNQNEAGPLSDSDNAQMEDSDDIIPDGGWGWVVCFASFMINFILDGTMFSFGVIMLELLDYFGDSKSKTALVGSLLLGMSMLMGPLVSFLLRRYSCRQVTVLGSLISAFGFIISMFAPNVETLIVTFGVIGGIGFSMIFLPSIIIVGLYFNKKRAIATGIATSGSGLGTVTYAYFCDRLLDTYNWRGTVLILGGLVLNCCVCGFLFRPLVDTRLRKKIKKENMSTDSSGYGGSREENYDKEKANMYESLKPLLNKQVDPQPANHRQQLLPSDLRKNSSARLFQSAENIRSLPVPSQRLHSSSHNLCVQNSLSEPQNMRIRLGLSKPLLRKDIFYSGSISHLPDYQHCDNISQFVAEMTQDGDTVSIETVHDRCRPKSGWLERLKLTFGTYLFKRPVFIFLLITFTMWTVHSVPITYIPDFAVSRGIDRTQAALLLSFVGITNILGRIIAGIVTDIFKVRSIIIYICALFVASVVNYVLPWCQTFAMMALCGAIFGLCMAVAVSMRTIVLADNLGIEHLTSSFGLVAMFQGMAFTAFPPIAGKLYDINTSFLYPFVMAGTMYLISCICSCIVYFIARRNGPRQEVIITVEEPNYACAEEDSKNV